MSDLHDNKQKVASARQTEGHANHSSSQITFRRDMSCTVLKTCAGTSEKQTHLECFHVFVSDANFVDNKDRGSRYHTEQRQSKCNYHQDVRRRSVITHQESIRRVGR